MSFLRLVSFVYILTAATSVVSNESVKNHNELTTIRFSTAIIPPYQVYKDDGEVSGYAVAIVQCITDKLKLKSDIEVYPWARAQKVVENGERDAFFVASQNETRDSYAILSKPLFSGKRSWYIPRHSTFNPNDIDVKEIANVGTVFGTNMHALLKKDFKNVVTKTTEQELIELLKLKRLDAVLLTDMMFNHTTAKMDIPPETFEKRLAKQKPLGVYFNKGFINRYPDLLRDFNSRIDHCVNKAALP